MEDEDLLLSMFAQEAVEHLETIEPNLLTLEKDGDKTDPEVINNLFRAVHSIKGTSGFFGLTNVSNISHCMENLLGQVRDQIITPDEEVSGSLLAGLDKLEEMIRNLNLSESVNAQDVIQRIEAVLENHSDKKADPKNPSSETPQKTPDQKTPDQKTPDQKTPDQKTPDQDTFNFCLENYPDACQDSIAHGRSFHTITLVLPKTVEERVNHIMQISTLLQSVGVIVASNPAVLDNTSLEDLTPEQDKVSLLCSTVLDREMLQSMAQISGDQIQSIEIPKVFRTEKKPTEKEPTEKKQDKRSTLRNRPINPVDSDAKPKEPSGKAANAPGAPTTQETLRVSVTLLDDLINSAGELVLARNQILRAATQVSAQFPELTPLIQNLNTVTSRVQEKVMQTRMQPVSVVFNKFPRIVRDLSKKLNKKIDLKIHGEDVELDKSVIEHLSDPLTHMIRNVADHGIEWPHERLAAGKSEVGRVMLVAEHESGMVNISLSDDGAGIDPDRIKNHAVKKGVITESQAETLSEQEAINLIFSPGFSTAKNVSDVSGRGVGMDVVRTNIEKLGGNAQIQSTLGKGTRVILKLPLTLAIIPAMTVSVAEQRFAVPEVGLVEIVRVTGEDRSQRIELVGNAPVLRLRNMLLPLIELADVLGIRNPQNQQEATNHRVTYVMVLKAGNNEFGVLVDEVMDSEEIVLKPLPSFFKDDPCLSATTILGDGGVALVIDIAGLVSKAHILFKSVERAGQEERDRQQNQTVDLRERQNLVVLETETGTRIGIVHGMIQRVEKIDPSDIEYIGGFPYVRYHDKTFRAIYPEETLGLATQGFGKDVEKKRNDLCMVIPNIPDIQAGLIFSRIIDTMETVIELDLKSIQRDGLMGTAHLDNRVVLFPDVFDLFELARIVPPAKTVVDGTGSNALVVNDTSLLRAITASFLNSAGFFVTQAESGKQAMTFLKNQSFDLLVTDLVMPDMDGFALAHDIGNTRNTNIPRLALSSSFSETLKERCRQAGFSACIPTIHKKQLLEATAMMLQGN